MGLSYTFLCVNTETFIFKYLHFFHKGILNMSIKLNVNELPLHFATESDLE
jgi:hypothetical protein